MQRDPHAMWWPRRPSSEGYLRFCIGLPPRPPSFFPALWKKLTYPSLPIMSTIRKTEKTEHRRESGPQHILQQAKLSSFCVKKAYMPIDANHISNPARCQPLPAYPAPPGPACTLISPGLSFTVVACAFVPVYIFFFIFGGRKLTCPAMPIMSATRKTDKANHRRVSVPQHILRQG